MKSEKYLSMAKDIRSIVEDLLDEYNTFEPSISKMFLDGQPLYEQAIKFTHLVYSFDPNPGSPSDRQRHAFRTRLYFEKRQRLTNV